MAGLFRLLFLGPFWVLLLLAALSVVAGQYAQRDWQEKAAAARLLATTSQPAPVAIEEYEGSRKPGLTEVNLRVRLLFDYGVHLTITGKSEREYYIVPFGADRGGDGKEVLGAMMLTPEERDRFLALEDLQGVVLPDGVHATLPGMIEAPLDRSDARKAIAERGAVIGPGFLFLSPFLEPRDAAIARIVKTRTSTPPAPFFNGLAAILALIGGVKFLLARRRRGRPARPKQVQTLLRTGSAEEARTAAELGYVPSGQKMFGKIPIPKMSPAVGLVVFVLSAGLWVRLKTTDEFGPQQWLEIAVVIAGVALLQFWPLIRARITHGPSRARGTERTPAAAPGEPVRMEPVRLSEFMAHRDGHGGPTLTPVTATAPAAPAPAPARADVPPPLPRGAPSGPLAAVMQLGGLLSGGVRLWLLLFVAAALGARLLPPEMRANYGALISVALSFGMIGIFVQFYLRAAGRGVAALFGHRKPAAEDPFERLHRQLRG